MSQTLTNRIERKIPFYEVDAIRMLWHGNYVKYLEEGREAFGEEFGLQYLHIFECGYVVPVVDLHLQYRQTAVYGDTLIIETTYVPTKAAKLIFRYEIRRKGDNALILEATSTQLFVTADGEFDMTTPDFVRQWRDEHGV